MNTSPRSVTRLNCPAWLLKLVLAGFSAGLVPARWHRGVWRRITGGGSGIRFDYEITIDHRRFQVPVLPDVNDQLVLDGLNGYENEVFLALRRTVLASRPVILDVGGNIGQYVLRLKAIWPDAEIHTFEPFPQLADALAEMKALNGWQDVRTNACAVGATATKSRLFFDGVAAYSASMVEGFQRANQQSIEVDCTTLDDYVSTASLKRIDLLKIDVEGGELEVIQGAAQVLDRHRPLILMELLWTDGPKPHARQQHVIDILRSADYHFHLIRSNGALERQAVPRPDPHYQLLNFLVVPGQAPT